MPRIEATPEEVVEIQKALGLDADTAAGLLVSAKGRVGWMDGFRAMSGGKKFLVVTMIPLAAIGALGAFRRIFRRRQVA